jgi:hypothetical protein
MKFYHIILNWIITILIGYVAALILNSLDLFTSILLFESISNSWMFLLAFVFIHSIIIKKSTSLQELKQSLLLAMGLNFILASSSYFISFYLELIDPRALHIAYLTYGPTGLLVQGVTSLYIYKRHQNNSKKLL